jgi:hypothetical protein
MAPQTINNYPWFEELVFALRCEGYKCETTLNGKKKAKVTHANTCMVKGNNIRAAFTRPYPPLSHEPYPCLQERIAADNEKCFDKFSKCPVVVKMPSDIPSVLAVLKDLSSERGFHISNSFEYLDNNPWPHEL